MPPAQRPPIALRLTLAGLLLALAVTCAPADSSNPAAQTAYESGLAAKRASDLPTALHRFQEATALDHDFADAYWGQAWCLVGLGRDAEAVEAFRWVIRLAPLTDNGVEAAKSIERITLRNPNLGLPPAEPETFMIALSVTRAGNTDLYLADAGGSLQRRLTTNPAPDTQPCFSPDAHQIIFVSERSGTRNLWSLKADGTGLQPVTEGTAANYSPTAAPDGKSVAFVSERSGKPELWTVDLQTGATTSLGQTSGHDLAPAWSPAGAALAFVSDQSGTEKLYLWNPLTREAKKLLANTIPEQHPVWSPDGKFLYFAWNLEGHWQICRAQPSGDGLEAVAPSPDEDHLWGISPDGQWMLISSDRGGISRLYLRATTGEEKPVLPGGGEVTAAALSPALPQSVAQILYTSKPPPRAIPGPTP
jgi:WD40 repeat protein